MKKIVFAVPAILFAALPLVASAHQHASYIIGGTQYDFVVGSLGEPVVVDDKTGVDLRVTSGGHMQMAEDGDMEALGGKPAAGLEKSLKVELIAGDKKKTLDLSPVYNTPGSYKATFFPTRATTYSYRIFGSLSGTPVDLTFTCLPEGQTAKDEGEKQIADGVKQLMKGGGFGCPLEKSDLGFPDATPTILALSASNERAGWTLALALAALALAVVAFVKRR